MLNVNAEESLHTVSAGPSLMPLLDVMLLLLIFFLLTSVFAQPTLEVDLPGASHSEPSAAQQDVLIISIDPDGQLFVNRKVILLSELKHRLASALKQNHNLSVMIRADKQSAFEHFVTVMDVIKGVGAKQLVIETQTRGREAGQ